MGNTTNYNLYKPLKGDIDWAGKLNENMDSIDGVLKSHDESLNDKTNQFNSIEINVAYPPIPMIAVKGNANYLNPTDHKWYKDSGFLTLADDDTTRLQNILNTVPIGSKVVISVPCRITNTISINVQNLTITSGGNRIGGVFNDGSGKDAIQLAPSIEGIKLHNLCVFGNDTNVYAPNATTGHGIVLNASRANIINECIIQGHGGHGIYLQNGVWIVDIIHNTIKNNKLDGINAINVTGALLQVNAINIQQNDIYGGGGNGINTWGLNINIKDNCIQNFNASGIIISCDYLTTNNGYCGGVQISGNYFEKCKNGFITLKTGIVGNLTHRIYGLKIEYNYGLLSNTYVNNGITALVTHTSVGTNPSTATTHMLEYGINYFNPTGLNIADFGDMLGKDSTVKNQYYGGGTNLIVGYGMSKVEGVKTKVLQGLFYCKGLSYTAPEKSVNITTTTDNIYYPLTLPSFAQLTSLGIYAETDSTDYSVRFAIMVKNRKSNTPFVEAYNTYLFAHKSGSLFHDTGEMYVNTAIVDTRLIDDGDNIIDYIVKIKVTLYTPGTYFYLGNLSVGYTE